MEVQMCSYGGGMIKNKAAVAVILKLTFNLIPKP